MLHSRGPSSNRFPKKLENTLLEDILDVFKDLFRHAWQKAFVRLPLANALLWKIHGLPKTAVEQLTLFMHTHLLIDRKPDCRSCTAKRFSGCCNRFAAAAAR